MTTRKLTIFFLLFLSCYINAEQRNYVKDELDLVENLVARSIGSQIKNAIEKLREMMKTGNKSLGIPVLDPFELDFYKLNVSFNGSYAVGNMSELYVGKLSEYTIQQADFKIGSFKLTIDLLWPLIVGKTNYDVKGTALEKFPFYGTGDISFKVKNFKFATDAKLKLDGKTRKMSIKGFENTALSIEDIKVDITGLFNHEDLSKLVSQAVSDLIPDTLQEYQEEVTAVVDEILLVKGNEFLANYTLGFP